MGHDHAASAHHDRLIVVFLITTAILVVEVIGG
jgi:Co/Zn/Cd efflux system component